MKTVIKLLVFILALFLFSVPLLYPQDAERWYLISETELLTIEEYRKTSEQERQSWLSQVQALNMRAEKLEAESVNLNSQLRQAREDQRRSNLSFNEYEKEQLEITSQKNNEIQSLKAINSRQTKVVAGLIAAVIVLVVLLGVAVWLLVKK